MADMAVKPTGDVDRDFVAMMIPHHQGAIDMAQAVLRYGRNEQLRRLAQEIIVKQQQEIAAMRLALGDPLPAARRPASAASRLPDRPPSPGRSDMTRTLCARVLLVTHPPPLPAFAGQAPVAADDPDIPISHRDRVYAAEQFSNTVSVTDPADNRLLGVIRLGDPQPGNLSPLYRGQVLVHGMGFSPDHRTLAVVSIGSNSVTFIDTATNAVQAHHLCRPLAARGLLHAGRQGGLGHGARRGLHRGARRHDLRGDDAASRCRTGRACRSSRPTAHYGYVCSVFTPETVVIDVADHEIVGRVKQDSPFCPNIAATPDGSQVWLTLKDVGQTMVFDAQAALRRCCTSLDTGPITNHVNFVRNAARQLRLRHRRRPERGQGLPHRRLRPGRDHPGRRAAARRLAVRRRHPRSMSGWRTPTRSR